MHSGIESFKKYEEAILDPTSDMRLTGDGRCSCYTCRKSCLPLVAASKTRNQNPPNCGPNEPP